MQSFFEHYLAHNTRQNQSFNKNISFDIMNIYHEQIGTWPNVKYEI